MAPADIDETPRPSESADELVRRLAAEKAATIGARSDADAVIVAADTMVVLDGDPLGKPVDADEARSMLRRLDGREHRVLTGVAVATADRLEVEVAATTVWFRALGDELVEWYVSTGEWDGKAGAYGIQGRGALLVERIDGPYDNVVGLPMVTLDRLLRRVGPALHSLAEVAGV